jgi:hypothetical protein
MAMDELCGFDGIEEPLKITNGRAIRSEAVVAKLVRCSWHPYFSASPPSLLCVPHPFIHLAKGTRKRGFEGEWENGVEKTKGKGQR